MWTNVKLLFASELIEDYKRHAKPSKTPKSQATPPVTEPPAISVLSSNIKESHMLAVVVPPNRHPLHPVKKGKPVEKAKSVKKAKPVENTKPELPERVIVPMTKPVEKAKSVEKAKPVGNAKPGLTERVIVSMTKPVEKEKPAKNTERAVVPVPRLGPVVPVTKPGPGIPNSESQMVAVAVRPNQ